MGNEHDAEQRLRAFGHGLPGTGGDAAPIDDVEGHRLPSGDGVDDEAGRIPQASPRMLPTDSDEDVEGHLYRGGPTTEGEFARRGPDENPHGER